MNGYIDELKIYKRALSSFEAYGLFFNPPSNKEYNTDVEDNPNTVVERDENGSVKSKSTFIENIELKRKTDNVNSAITIGSTEAEVALNINTNVQIDDNSIITEGSNITLPATGTLATVDDIDHLNVFKEWDETYTYSLNEPAFYEGVPYKSLVNNLS